MNKKLRYLFLFLLTAVFSLLPICFAAPEVVMAEVSWQYVEEGDYEKGNPQDEEIGWNKYHWTIYKNSAREYKLVIEGESLRYMDQTNFFYNAVFRAGNEENDDAFVHVKSNGFTKLYLIDTDSKKTSSVCLSDFTEVEFKKTEIIYDNVFEYNDEENGIYSALKRMTFDHNLDDYNHCGYLPNVESLYIDIPDNGYSKYKIDGSNMLRDTGGNQVYNVLIWHRPAENEKEYSVPADITVIGENAFKNQKQLEKIEFPDTLERIAEDAFWGTRITSIHLPKNVNSLGYDPEIYTDVVPAEYVKAFNYMDHLQEITVDPDNNTFKSVDGILYSKNGEILCRFPQNKYCNEYSKVFSVPSTVKKLAYYCFDGAVLDYIIVTKNLEQIIQDLSEDEFRSCALNCNVEAVCYEGSPDEWRKLFKRPMTDKNYLYMLKYNLPLIHCNTTDPSNIPKSRMEGTYYSPNAGELHWKIEGTEGDYTLTVEGKPDEEIDKPELYPYVDKIDKLYYMMDSMTGDLSSVPMIKINHLVLKNIYRFNTGSLFPDDDQGITNDCLESIYLPKTLIDFPVYGIFATIGSIELEPGSESFTLEDGILFEKSLVVEGKRNLILYPAYKTEESYVVPNDVISIGEYTEDRFGGYAFGGNKYLKDVKLNEGLVYIGHRSFALCDKITEITLPSTYKNFYSDKNIYLYGDISSFELMTGLQRINVAKMNKYYSSKDGLLLTKDGSMLCFYPPAKEAGNMYSVPDHIKTLGMVAFRTARIKELYIPKTVTGITPRDEKTGQQYPYHDYLVFEYSSIEKIYYQGSEEEWNKLYVKENLDPRSPSLPEMVFDHDPDDTKPVPQIIPDNKPRNYYSENRGDLSISMNHDVVFHGNAKIDLDDFGEEGITVSIDGATYMASKIKVNKKKKLIQITGLTEAEKPVEKAVKKATKGKNGIKFNIFPYYVKEDDIVTAKYGKYGVRSVKINIFGKNYKLKKNEWEYDFPLNLLRFKKNFDGERECD